MRELNRVFIGLGSNVGDRTANLRMAREALSGSDSFLLTAASAIYETEPQGFAEQAEFLNQVVAGVWTGVPWQLLALCRHIEDELGRERPFANAPRTIDLDILFWEHRSIHSDELVVPHERLTERAFALWPLLEVAPSLLHPDAGRLMRSFITSELLAQGIKRFEGEPAVV